MTWKVLLVLAILFTHYGLRNYAAQSVPLNARGFYPEDYAVALSLVSGKGFNSLGFTKDPVHGLAIPNAGPATPIVSFLRLQRDSLSREEIEEYFRGVYVRAIPDPISVTRILDLRLAALIWKTFGVRWSTLFRLYSLLSTLVCFLIFCTARRLSGSYWAGCLAAICCAGSVQEIKFATISIRDASPFWFAAIAFFWLVCLTDRYRSVRWNLVSAAGLGAVSVIGCGWRTDAYLLPPFLLTVFIVWLISKGRRLTYTLSAATLFVCGCLAMSFAIGRLGSNQSHLSAQIFFDVASYGNATRSNLFHLENSFQIPRNDYETYVLSNFYWSIRHPASALPSFLSDAYAVAMKELYWEYLKYNAFNWYWEFPAFYFKTIQNVALPNELTDVSSPVIVGILILALSVFIILGFLPVFAVCSDKVLTVSLYLFSVYYSVILLLVLPEGKHQTILVLPFAVLSGITGWLVARAIRTRTLFKSLTSVPRREILVVALCVLVTLSVWVLGLAALYHYSLAERAAYLRDIFAVAEHGRNASHTISRSTTFSAVLPQDAPSRGYLLKILAGKDSGDLVATHIRENARDLDLPYATRHPLYPGKEQFCFITIVPGKVVGDRGNARAIVTLEGDAKFISSTEVDLERWKRPAFTTVFHRDERIAGSPRLNKKTASIEFPNLQ